MSDADRIENRTDYKKPPGSCLCLFLGNPAAQLHDKAFQFFCQPPPPFILLHNSVLTIKNTIAGPSLVIKKRREVKVPPNSPCFLLDARGSSSLASQLFGINFEEIKVTKKMDCHIIQIVDGNYGITTLYNKETKKPKRSFYRLMEVVKNIVKLEGAENLFLCTWKKLTRFIEKMQKDGELSNRLSINHFGNIKGSNDHSERKACIILGTPCYPPDELHSIAQTAYYEQDYVVSVEKMEK